MDPINPWLDPIEVRRLADRLMQPSREQSPPVTDPGFDEGFIGFAPDHSPAPIPVISPAIPMATQVLPIAPTVVSEPQIQVARVPIFHQEIPVEIPISARGPFLDRIIRFRDWMRLNFAATGVFILDREGAVIFDESNHGRLHFLARSLALASRRPGATGRNVHVKISAESTLEVIPVETPYGCLVLGAVVPESLNPASVMAVMDALVLVSSRPGEG
jgi:hypothetical protein